MFFVMFACFSPQVILARLALKNQLIKFRSSANQSKIAKLEITHFTSTQNYFTSDDGGCRDQKNIIRHNGIMHSMAATTNMV
jgi:hypothetical protein